MCAAVVERLSSLENSGVEVFTDPVSGMDVALSDFSAALSGL